MPPDLRRTPLHDLHDELGARMTPFAGYEMPVQYRDGVLAEHRWTRTRAGLFDVSHMGQARLRGPDAAGALEALVCGDVKGLAPGAQRYTLLLNDEGGIMDDLMVSRPDDDGLFLVVNAATKDADFAHIAAALDSRAALELLEDRALLALQGPAAADVLAEVAPEVVDLAFMQARALEVAGEVCLVSRSGYTGEDGFEISMPAARAETLARLLLASEGVHPIGLGARDSLRLEAGLCLYGHDIDETTSPVEAALAWTIPPHRRKQGDFPGAKRIRRELQKGPERKRVGLALKDKAPAREGARIATEEGDGVVTSGGFAPTLNAPVAMGYVPGKAAAPGARVTIELRGRALEAEIVKTPFVPHRYARTAG
jgi:aminomethyltransferase